METSKMPFIPTTEKEVLANLQYDLLVPFHTIHDEVDFVVSDFLLEPLINKVAKMSAVKDVFDIIGVSSVNFLADCEFDNENGSFLPLNSFDPYSTPSSEREANAKDLMKSTEIKRDIIKIETDNIATFKEIMERDINGVFVQFILPNKTIMTPYPVSLACIEKYQSIANQKREVIDDE